MGIEPIVGRDTCRGEGFARIGYRYCAWANDHQKRTITDMCGLIDQARSGGFELTVAGEGVVAKDQLVGFDDIELVKDLDMVGLRQEMECKASA